MAGSSRFHSKSEARKFFRILAVTVAVFMCVATTQIMIFSGHPTIRHYILPLIFSLIVGSTFGWNAILRHRLEISNRVKSDFISLISHEIRTPLTVINGFSRVLAEASELKDRDKDFAKRIYYSGEHLLTIINDLLDMSAIESGKINIEMRELELTNVLKDCCSMMQSMAEKSGITIIEKFEQGNIHTFADLTRLKQVILNLLSNAIKYNKQDGNVKVSLDDGHPEYCRVFIEDTGLGIPEDKWDTIFIPFERLERDKTQIRGTGLGLPISRRLINIMGGDIGFTSQSGEGSTFWVDVKKT
jgi:signal transduction histidine kinase